MTISISEALKLSPLVAGQLIAGAEGVNRNICNVRVLELPSDSHFMSYGELMLITSASKVDAKELNAYLQLSYQQQPAGLVITTESDRDQLITLCNDLELPLIQLDSNVPIRAIEQELVQRLRQYNDRLAILEKQRSLLKLAMNNDPSTSLFDQISYCLNYPIAILSSKGQLLFNNSSWSAAELAKLLPQSNASTANYVRSEANYHLLSLPSHTIKLGYVLIMHDLKFVNTQEELLFFQSADIIASHLRKFFSSQLTKESYAFNLWLQSKLFQQHNEEEAPSLAAEPLSTVSLICFVTTAAAQESVRLEQQLHLAAKIFEDLSSQYKLHFAHIANEKGLTTILYSSSHSLIEAISEQKWLEEVSVQLSAQPLAQAKLQVAVSKPKHQLNQLRAAYDECLQALHLCRQLHIKQTFITFSELEFNYILQHIPPTIRTQFSTNLLRPLLTKEEHYKTEMLKTLDAFIEHEGSVTETAKALFIHRNTVLYRIDKASELLGMDFKKLSHLMQLKLALVFYKLTADSSAQSPHSNRS